jgi:hypothetical protein
VNAAGGRGREWRTAGVRGAAACTREVQIGIEGPVGHWMRAAKEMCRKGEAWEGNLRRGKSQGVVMLTSEAPHGKPHMRRLREGRPRTRLVGNGGRCKCAGELAVVQANAAGMARPERLRSMACRGLEGKDRREWTWAENVPRTGRKERGGRIGTERGGAMGGLQKGATRSKIAVYEGPGWMIGNGAMSCKI